MHVCAGDDAELERVRAERLFVNQTGGQRLANVAVLDLALVLAADQVRELLEVGELVVG